MLRARLVRIACVCVVLVASFARAEGELVLSPIERDAQRLQAIFDSNDEDRIDEALVQLRWAGIRSPALYWHLLQVVLAGGPGDSDVREQYVVALGYSGDPAIYAQLRALATNELLRSSVRDDAETALAQADRYTDIANVMNVGLDAAGSVEELWAMRHRLGLHVDDQVRVRLAARDLYLYRYGKPSLDVAEQVLRANVLMQLDDDSREDAIAFLCKALGVSRIADYKEVLVYAANNAVNDKLSDYAERSVQYIDPEFEAHRVRD